jgi:uncharacterized membrane protein
MKNINKVRLTSMIAAVMIISGCQSITHAQNIAGSGLTNMTCAQINSAFDAYNADKTSISSLTALMGVSTDSIGSTISASEYYTQARDAANVALMVKGCGPL